MNIDFLKNKLQSKALSTDKMALITVAGVNYVDTFGATLYDLKSGVYYQTTLPNDNTRDGILSLLTAAWASNGIALVVYAEGGPVVDNQQAVILKQIALSKL
jgi:hypothetical protein